MRFPWPPTCKCLPLSTKADTCLRARPLFLWKSIDSLIMMVVTPLLAIRVVVAPLDMEACFCNTSLPSQDGHRNGHPHHPDPDFNRGARPRSRSVSPRPTIQHSGRPRPPLPGLQSYAPQVRQPVGPAQPSVIPAHRGSSRTYYRRDPSHPDQEQSPFYPSHCQSREQRAPGQADRPLEPSVT